MKAILLDGMLAGDGPGGMVHQVLVGVLEERGWEVAPFVLRDMEVRPCTGCFGCWVQTPGRCLRHDVDEIAETYMNSDLAVYLTPVTFGGYSSELKKVLDRLICLILPFFQQIQGETHHKRRYDKYPNLLAVGVLPRHDEESEAIFRRLVERNAINMWIPTWKAGFVTGELGQADMQAALAGLLDGGEVAR